MSSMMRFKVVGVPPWPLYHSPRTVWVLYFIFFFLFSATMRLGVKQSSRVPFPSVYRSFTHAGQDHSEKTETGFHFTQKFAIYRCCLMGGFSG